MSGLTEPTFLSTPPSGFLGSPTTLITRIACISRRAQDTGLTTYVAITECLLSARLICKGRVVVEDSIAIADYWCSHLPPPPPPPPPHYILPVVSGLSLHVISQLRTKYSSSNCPNHVRRTKSLIQKRAIVRRTVRSMFGEQTLRPVKNRL